MHKNLFILVGDDETPRIVDNLDNVRKRDYTVIRVEFGSDGRAMHAALVPCGVGGGYEPTFTLRASDAMAADYVAHWSAMAELMQVPQEKVISAKSVSRAMAEWKTKKIPD